MALKSMSPGGGPTNMRTSAQATPLGHGEAGTQHVRDMTQHKGVGWRPQRGFTYTPRASVTGWASNVNDEGGLGDSYTRRALLIKPPLMPHPTTTMEIYTLSSTGVVSCQSRDVDTYPV